MSLLGRYAQGLRTSVRSNSTAYGYSIMITACFGMTSAEEAKPGAAEIFLFAFGAVAGFVAVHLAATRGFRTQDADGERTDVQLLAALLNFVSVLAAVGAGELVAWLGQGWWVWALAPLAASAVFLLVNGAEFALAEEEEEG